MIQNKSVNFIVQVIIKGLKQKLAVKTCIQQKYAIFDFKSKMYPQRDQKNVSFEIGTKCLQSNEHKSKLIPNIRVTKLLTHADTLQMETLTLQENICRNIDKAGENLNKKIKVIAVTIQNSLDIHIKQNLQHVLNNRTKKIILSVETFSQP